MVKKTVTKAGNTGTVTEKSAGAIVFFGQDAPEFLLLRSKYWEFPKGLIEVNESEEAGAIREVREETGLEISLLPGFRESIEYFYRRKDGTLVKKQVVYFLGAAQTQEYKISWEHQEAQWLPFDQALATLEYENSRALLRKAKERLDQIEK